MGWWNAGSSFLAWLLWGKMSCHSRLAERLNVKMAGRCENKASHRRKTKKRREIKEIADPADEMTFHDMYASG